MINTYRLLLMTIFIYLGIGFLFAFTTDSITPPTRIQDVFDQTGTQSSMQAIYDTGDNPDLNNQQQRQFGNPIIWGKYIFDLFKIIFNPLYIPAEEMQGVLGIMIMSIIALFRSFLMIVFLIEGYSFIVNKKTP